MSVSTGLVVGPSLNQFRFECTQYKIRIRTQFSAGACTFGGSALRERSQVAGELGEEAGPERGHSHPVDVVQDAEHVVGQGGDVGRLQEHDLDHVARDVAAANRRNHGVFASVFAAPLAR